MLDIRIIDADTGERLREPTLGVPLLILTRPTGTTTARQASPDPLTRVRAVPMS
jgi:hypothetical protein